MKRILFVVTNLGTGGTIRSIQNFLNRYDITQFEVDVFALTHQGNFSDELKNCNVISCHRLLDASIARYEDQKGLAKLESLIAKFLDKVTGYRFQQKLFCKVANQLVSKKQYDAVIGFSEGAPTSFVSMMNHPNKIAWIHCDYASFLNLTGIQSELTKYEKINHIVCVSDYTCRSFCNIYPLLEKKTTFIYNIIDDTMMYDKAQEPIGDSFNDNCFNIVSLGRIDPVKRLSAIPKMARRVADAGCRIKWYVIGPKGTTDEVELLNKNIRKFQTENIVRLLGEKRNPYPYIAHASLLVNTSVSEACPYVINEAKILHTPVVCTDFGSAKEFITNGVNGYSLPLEEMANCIIRLIQQPEELKRLRNNLESFSYDNDSILQKIYSLI